jgi:hypothetical protein
MNRLPSRALFKLFAVLTVVGFGTLMPKSCYGNEPTKAETDSTVSFVNDVVPILSRHGCNAGSCHGAARGKDGFALSLFGYDPAGDHQTLVREIPGRRIDLAMPGESLLLAKATGSVPHTGGKLFDKNSDAYQKLLHWIEQTAKFDGETAPQLIQVSMTPKEVVLEGHQSKQPAKVLAIYEDGAEREVTNLAAFSSSNSNVASISNDGRIVADRPGEAFVMARFGAHTVGCNVIVHSKDDGFEWPTGIEEANYIDVAILEKLRKLHIVPAPVCSDADFMRRVSVDLAGRLPSRTELASFVVDEDIEKRAKLIDRLLSTDDFERLWAMKWMDLLKVRSINPVSDKSIWKFSQWLKQNIHDGVPIKQWLTEMLTASGGEFENPPATFFQDLPDQKKVAEDVAQVFLGMRIQCAQCHNHPFDRWTMDDYYGFVAFFDMVRRKRGTDPRERIIFSVKGKTLHPVTKEVVKPRFLGGENADATSDDPRIALASWMTSDDNPYFAPNLANRIWEQFFGIGIVNEVDDVRVSNPPVNQILLDQLAERLIATEFDFKALARDICNSHAYQRGTMSGWNSVEAEKNFGAAKLRRIRAEVLLDIISQVTETTDDFAGLPAGASATEIPDGKTTNHFLNTFGKSTRQSVCACEVNTQPNLSQALHLINGDTVHNKIGRGKVIQKMVKSKTPNPEIIEDIFLRCLSRSPTERELDQLMSELKSGGKRNQVLQDIFWAVLNSREFVFNH